MGTNYYLHERRCDLCGKSDRVMHIGKSSGGWAFSFRAYDDIRSETAWRGKIEEAVALGGQIRDGFENVRTPDEFWSLVDEKRSLKKHAVEHPQYSFLDDKGNSFTDEEFS